MQGHRTVLSYLSPPKKIMVRARVIRVRVRAIKVNPNPNSPNPNPNPYFSGGVINRKVPIELHMDEHT